MKIGVIGLGAMGSAMAKNLAKAGHEVKAWNRSPVENLEQATLVGSPAEAFQGDVALTMLSDDDVIREVLIKPDILRKAKPGLIHVVCSTISVTFVEEFVRLHEELKLGYVAAPVLGRPDVAEKGELQVLVGGSPDDVEKVRPILEAIGKHVWAMGDEATAANIAKIACNMMITMAIEAMAEAVVLTESKGLVRDKFFELILGTLFASRSYQIYSEKITNSDYKAGFKATLGLKDLRLASEAAAQAGRDLPVLDAVHNQMDATVRAGMGDRDWSAMADFTLATPSDQTKLAIAGVHHFKLPVTDLAESLAFYKKLLGAAPIPGLEHKHKDTGETYAHICDVPGLGTKLELRLNPEQSEKQRKWDPVTIAVKDRSMLTRWTARLDEMGIKHSGEIVAVQAWLVTFDDPSGNRLRFYTLEKHGPELSPDEGNEWLTN